MSRPQDDPYASGQIPSVQNRRASAQRTTYPPPGAVRASRGQEALYSNPQPGRNTFIENDMLWAGLCLVLGLACAVALILWLVRIFTGLVDGSRLTTLFVAFLIYLLCIGAGWLWGRYQSAPAQGLQQQQLADVQRQVEFLTQRNQGLQQALQKLSSPANSEISRPEPAIRTSRPQRVSSASPPVSIYDQQIEPADKNDLLRHPHQKCFPSANEQNELDYSWRLIGASMRGFSHGYEGKYREDDFQVTLLRGQVPGPTIALVAIADGVSSKSLSRRGALAAVQGAAGLSEAHVGHLRALLARASNLEEIYAAGSEVLLQSLQRARQAVNQAASTIGVPVEELQSTLLVFLAAALSPEQLFLASVQIGDGAIFGLKTASGPDLPPNARWQQLLPPQIQAAGNEVRPFMYSNHGEWRKYIRCNTLPSFTGIMAMTDGIADDIEPPMPSAHDPQPDPFSLVDKFHHLYVVPALQSPRPADELLKLIGYHKKQSYDDRTLVYLYQL